jgi:hypothetical protein
VKLSLQDGEDHTKFASLVECLAKAGKKAFCGSGEEDRGVLFNGYQPMAFPNPTYLPTALPNPTYQLHYLGQPTWVLPDHMYQ